MTAKLARPALKRKARVGSGVGVEGDLYGEPWLSPAFSFPLIWRFGPDVPT